VSIDFDPDAKLNQIGARFTVSNAENDRRAASLIHSMAFQRLRDQLSSLLSQDAMRITPNKYSTDYEIRLYVLTADQLEKYVQKRAERMGYLPSAITEQTYE
jgi:hypothetical protein